MTLKAPLTLTRIRSLLRPSLPAPELWYIFPVCKGLSNGQDCIPHNFLHLSMPKSCATWLHAMWGRFHRILELRSVHPFFRSSSYMRPWCPEWCQHMDCTMPPALISELVHLCSTNTHCRSHPGPQHPRPPHPPHPRLLQCPSLHARLVGVWTYRYG